MFTRSELEIKTLLELKNLCRNYGIKPIGKGSMKSDYINALTTFHKIAIRQMNEGQGFKVPKFDKIEAISEALYQISTPTLEQSALIKATLAGRKLLPPDRFEQEKLFALYRAKWHLEQLVILLAMQ